MVRLRCLICLFLHVQDPEIAKKLMRFEVHRPGRTVEVLRVLVSSPNHGILMFLTRAGKEYFRQIHSCSQYA